MVYIDFHGVYLKESEIDRYYKMGWLSAGDTIDYENRLKGIPSIASINLEAFKAANNSQNQSAIFHLPPIRELTGNVSESHDNTKPFTFDLTKYLK